MKNIHIQLIKDGKPNKEFNNLQECFQYFRGFLPSRVSNKTIYDIINRGIDEDRAWEGYEFKVSEEIKQQRVNRNIRKSHTKKYFILLAIVLPVTLIIAFFIPDEKRRMVTAISPIIFWTLYRLWKSHDGRKKDS